MLEGEHMPDLEPITSKTINRSLKELQLKLRRHNVPFYVTNNILISAYKELKAMRYTDEDHSYLCSALESACREHGIEIRRIKE